MSIAPPTPLPRRIRYVPSGYDGRKVTWRTPTDVLMHGCVEATDYKDQLYVRVADGRLFIVELYRAVWGHVTL